MLACYGRERRVFGLPEAVRKTTSMPADQIGLSDRGRIAVGKKADPVVFNPATVKDEATFDTPHRYASGIPDVLVNGVVVVENSVHTGAKPGRALRRGSARRPHRRGPATRHRAMQPAHRASERPTRRRRYFILTI